MIRRFLTVLAVGSLSLQSAPAAVTDPSGDALDAGLLDDTRLGGPVLTSPQPSEPVTTVRAPPPQEPAAARPLSANPLWAIPLAKLSNTRDRPVFSPSRRPPPPAVAEAPVVSRPPSPRKAEAEPPQLSLVGTIAGDDESFGIFLDQSSKAALRLKIGEDFQGWTLRTIQGREVTMVKDEQGAVMTMPAPGREGSGEVRLVPITARAAQTARH
ncbi:hypothetical protein [Bradyrhizobium lablabi]|uniref:hypothetical protein n=1 Tax=Bradyrhizobium lablabi TaxID=722472 RepID=UPI001BA95A2A|nr:hypothetical protein [Bradyrhizobium lablabi]MBR0696470.1 hypothetical protein [Bradyrhizobium lablabi]